MREGDGSILGTIGLKKLLEIDIFISLCDNSAQKRSGKCGNLIKLVNFFQNQEGQSNL